MKKLITTLTLYFIVYLAYPCDICGSSAGNYFSGPFPQFKKHFIGTRYSIRTYYSQMKNSGEFSKDVYQTTEIWGGFQLSRHWQMLIFFPYNFNRQTMDEGTRKSAGLGDITILSNLKIFEQSGQKSNGNYFSQQLLAGAGLKFPSGHFAADKDEFIPDVNNQPGTGSIDLIVNGVYNLHFKNWGLSSNINYKINHSASHFKFGNRLSTSAFIIHSFYLDDHATIHPNLGIMYEDQKANSFYKAVVTNSGGNATFISMGTDLNFKKCVMGCNVQLPVAHNLSEHQTQPIFKCMVHMTFLF